jgi:hypothetical protein
VDFTVCADAVPTLTSRWSGTLMFNDGYSSDARLRTDASGAYGVIGTRVVVRSSRGQAFFDYCVEGDLLRIHDPDSGQHVLLRRGPMPLDAPPR